MNKANKASKASEIEAQPKRTRRGIDSSRLKRTSRPEEKVLVNPSPESPPAASGLGATVVELAFNPSREKIREVTIIDKMQGRLFPLLDMINSSRKYIMDVAIFRYDSVAYVANNPVNPIPVPPDLVDEFMFRTAQWQKSVQGVNLQRATDIALAETEMKGGEEEDSSGGGADNIWKE